MTKRVREMVSLHEARTNLRRPIAGVLAATMLLSGCAAWRTIDVGPSLEPRREERVRVVRTNGTTLRLWNAQLTRDSLTGDERVPADPETATAEEWSRGYRLQKVTMPLTAVQRMDSREKSAGATVLAVLGGIAGLYVLALTAFLIGG